MVRLLNAVTVLSLLPCAAVLASWVDSNFSARTISYLGNRLGAQVMTRGGDVFVYTGASSSGWGRQGWGYGSLDVPQPRRTLANNFEWFRYERKDRASGAERRVQVPLWFVTCLTLVPPAYRLGWHLIRSRRQFRAGLCPACGYDLRATPDRCPECGAAKAG